MAMAAMNSAFAGFSQVGGLLAMAGAHCADGDPARGRGRCEHPRVVDGPWQISDGFGSVWVSEAYGTEVVRLDPEQRRRRGDDRRREPPFKLQPADGRMWVRTGDAYVAVDPATNAVVATLSKPDVGPDAFRSWAVDGAMWICDGRRVHRYDPTTVESVAVIELGLECGQVTATAELAVAWTYNEDDPESGNSAAAFIDPATNSVLATLELPVDVGVPVVLDDVVFFAGYGGSTAVVVDRATWTVAVTPELGSVTGHSLLATDGERIFVPTVDVPGNVLVVDAGDYTVIDTIEPLGNNAVAVIDGELWTTGEDFGLVQR